MKPTPAEIQLVDHIEAESRAAARAVMDVGEQVFDTVEAALQKHGGATPQRMLLAQLHLAAGMALSLDVPLGMTQALLQLSHALQDELAQARRKEA